MDFHNQQLADRSHIQINDAHAALLTARDAYHAASAAFNLARETFESNCHLKSPYNRFNQSLDHLDDLAFDYGTAAAKYRNLWKHDCE